MPSYLEIVVIAAVTQLTVLPGEKVQLIIAGLSTRFDPLVVVGAAGTAFAGWTALEIAFGRAIQQALPAIALDAITAGLFVLFAVLLYRSAPAASGSWSEAVADGGLTATAAPDLDAELEVLGHTVGGRTGEFASIFAMMAAGEFGDKTQLVTISLAVQYGATSAIWVGEMLVIVPVSLANAYAFHHFSDRFDVRRVHLGGAAIFAFFAADTVLAMATGVSVWETGVSAIADVVLAPT